MNRLFTCLIAFFLTLAHGVGAQVNASDYSDPDGDFTIKVPEGWSVERERVRGACNAIFQPFADAWKTIIKSDQDKLNALILLTCESPERIDKKPQDLKSFMREEIGKPFFQGWIAALEEQAKVKALGKVYKTKVNHIDALRLDVTYHRGDEDYPRTGYAVFLFAKSAAFFVALTSSETAFAQVEEIFATWQMGPYK